MNLTQLKNMKEYKRTTIHDFNTRFLDEIDLDKLVKMYNNYTLTEGESLCLLYFVNCVGEEENIVLQSLRLETDAEQAERLAQEELKKSQAWETYRKRLEEQIESLQQSLKNLDQQELQAKLNG